VTSGPSPKGFIKPGSCRTATCKACRLDYKARRGSLLAIALVEPSVELLAFERMDATPPENFWLPRWTVTSVSCQLLVVIDEEFRNFARKADYERR
jgi:hypothetical protein